FADAPDRGADGTLAPDNGRILPLAVPPTSAQSQGRLRNGAPFGAAMFLNCAAQENCRTCRRSRRLSFAGTQLEPRVPWSRRLRRRRPPDRYDRSTTLSQNASR